MLVTTDGGIWIQINIYYNFCMLYFASRLMWIMWHCYELKFPQDKNNTTNWWDNNSSGINERKHTDYKRMIKKKEIVIAIRWNQSLVMMESGKKWNGITHSITFSIPSSKKINLDMSWNFRLWCQWAPLVLDYQHITMQIVTCVIK